MYYEEEDGGFETCDEYSARQEAEAELEADYQCGLADQAEEEAEDALRYPGGRCEWQSAYLPECVTSSCPF